MHSSAHGVKGDANALRDLCDKQIIEYAQRWPVVEWDVINEPRGNYDIQEILGEDEMVRWFRLAKENVRTSGALLYLNENRVISDPAPKTISKNMQKYCETMDFLLARKAPVTGIGFQSRFRGDLSAEQILARLNFFTQRYPRLPIAATEFEIHDIAGDERSKAAITAKVMILYFSHPQVNEIVNWSFFKGVDGRCLVENDGSPNLRGKTWLYLTKRLWATCKTLRSDARGVARIGRAFPGDYDVSVQVDGREFEQSVTLGHPDTSVVVKLPF